jgi:hypothetical protein
MDYEPALPKNAKRTSGVGLNNITNGSKSESEKASPTQSRKTLTNGTVVNSNANANANANAISKESIPGTSSFSSRPEENGSALRKRKQPASTPNSGSTGNPAKKIFTTAPGDPDGGHFTNMVSFEATTPYLKDGQLKADDGTTFAVNGQFPRSFAL